MAKVPKALATLSGPAPTLGPEGLAQEVDLLRAQLSALAGQAAQIAGSGGGAADEELDLLRAQLSALAGQLLRSTLPPALFPAAGPEKDQEIGLLRAQLSALTGQLSGAGPWAGGGAGPGSGQEIDLLRAQLSALAMLSLGGPVVGRAADELDLLRDQLQAISNLAAGHGPLTGAHAPAASAELDLLRAQLAALAPLIGGEGGMIPATLPPPASPAIAQGEEMRLLRETLARLMADLARSAAPAPAPAPKPPAAPAPDLAAIESAVARLLTELVEETDRRIRAERDAMQARALLRHHGLDSTPPPARIPAAPRRG